jgi:hypothetical protein
METPEAKNGNTGRVGTMKSLLFNYGDPSNLFKHVEELGEKAKISGSIIFNNSTMNSLLFNSGDPSNLLKRVEEWREKAKNHFWP